MSAERHQLLMRVLAEALECDTGGRAPMLDANCRGDTALRAEVERLLAREEAAARFLEEPVAGATSHAGLPEGERIGAYRVEREIGRGGMGVVYLASRNDAEFERRVAIKLVKRGMDTDFVIRRFRAERQILADLNHPHIARLFDGGTTDAGLPYLVMEHVEGVPLNIYADSHNLTTAERLRLFLKVCDAVAHAHHHAVVHRDIKPSNILVNEDGSPKLLDFGIAKILSPYGDGRAPEETVSTLRFMTPEYASPEHLRGERVTEATDIYSLGAVLYELLTGRPPHRLGRRSVGSARPISEQETTRPSRVVSSRDLRTKDSQDGSSPGPKSEIRNPKSLRGDLDNVVLMALRREPERRYASVEQFAEDIRRHLEGRPVMARGDTMRYRAAKSIRRHGTAIFAALAAAIVSLTLAVALGLLAGHVKQSKSVAVIPFANASRDAGTEYLADGVTDHLIERLSRFSGLTVPGHNSVFRYKEAALDPPVMSRALGVEMLLTGRLLSEGENLSANVELIDAVSGQTVWSKWYEGKVAGILIMQDEMAEDISQRLGRRADVEARAAHPHSQNVEAYQLYLKGKHFWSQRTNIALTKAIEYFEQAVDRDPQYALAYSGLANSYSLMAAYKLLPPKVAFPKARAAALKAVELDDSLAEAHTSLALVTWLYDWDWAAADREFRRAVELNPNYPTAPHWRALYLAEMGRFDEAVASAKRALELDPWSLYATADLARVYFYARRYDESLEQYRKAIAMDPTHGAFYAELAQLYGQMEMWDEYFSTIQAIEPDADNQTKIFAKRGREGYLRYMLEGSKKDGHDPWRQYVGRIVLYAQVGDKDRAFEWLNKAFESKDHQMAQLQVNPVFDPLRSDPRFTDLLRRMNLEP
jgi:serine/threonine protein kinase/TolB-like protein/Tfp pilus assembly protein PilF